MKDHENVAYGNIMYAQENKRVLIQEQNWDAQQGGDLHLQLLLPFQLIQFDLME